MTAALLPSLAACSGPFSTLDPAGPSAATAAWLWWIMFAFSAVVLVALTALWVFASVRQPKPGSEARVRQVHRRWLIGGGLLLPIGSVTALLIIGIPAGHSMLPLPVGGDPPLRIEVTGHMWWWEVHYPDHDVELRNVLHIPAGKPVDLHLTSADVIHSFWVPRLGGKLDMIPGRTNVLRLQADAPGSYRGQCAEFCGIGHAHMQFEVQAHEPDGFEQILREAADG